VYNEICTTYFLQKRNVFALKSRLPDSAQAGVSVIVGFNFFIATSRAFCKLFRPVAFLKKPEAACAVTP
jgi:hypothetical protein